MEEKSNDIKQKFNRFLRIMGPGLITGAADDDPSGIATFSQTGAQFGYGQLWTALFTLPLMTAVQEACARIGMVTGKGLVAVIKEHYSKKIVYAVVLLVLVANTINIGADIGAMAAAAKLLIPLPFVFLTLFFTAFILTLEIFTSYRVYARILKWLALSLLAYPITVFIVHEPWLTILQATFIPHIEFSFAFLFIIIGVLGTTISPYMFFWEASEEVEEEKEEHVRKVYGRPKIDWKHVRAMRLDNAIGMVVSQIATWCIIVSTATVLHSHGITTINTSADAAKALEPLVRSFPNAGYVSKLLFSSGIIGLGLLAVPVLSGSASYALSEALNWREGLNLKLKEAHGFYGIISVATLIGLLINFVGIDPVRALVYSAVFNGVAAVPLLFLIAKIARNEKIMGEYKSGIPSQVFVWITFFAMAAAAVAMFVTIGRK
jgi:NRAMP (natural resistance-associated macrophage protein)-like metal ion transporter